MLAQRSLESFEKQILRVEPVTNKVAPVPTPDPDSPPFAHLHVHSGYSELDGGAMPADLVKAAADNGMEYLAITDHGNLSAWPEFRDACAKAGVHPIYGCEFYLGRNHLVALAETNEGIGNIIALSTRGYLEGLDRKPRINKLMLKEHSRGIILLSACVQGEIPQALLQGDMDAAVALVRGYQEIVGTDNFYLETMNHGLEEELKVLETMPKLSERTGAPIVATNDVHYLRPEDVSVQNLLYTIRNGKESRGCPNCHFRSYDEMAEIFPVTYLTRALEIAERCSKAELTNPEIPDRVPRADVPDVEAFIRQECGKNMQLLYAPDEWPAVNERFAFELGVYKDMNMLDYAYIVYDIIRFAREQDIYTGPGRGSAAGSIVMYLLRVTDIEPLSNGLLFERFLAPGRVSMPDVDMDFESARRDEVFQYLRQKYGEQNTCRIINFSEFKPRSAFQDAARSLGIRPALTIEFSKTLNSVVPGEFEDAALANKLLAQHPVLKQALERSYMLLKLPRHRGVHACGFAISPRPMLTEVPLAKVGDEIVTQWEGSKVEDWLVKMDILGLESLDVIKETERHLGRRVNFQPNDPDIFSDLAAGRTVGVFQFESQGIINVVKAFVPNSQTHLVALNAMYRPGPLSEIPGMIERKFGRQPIDLIDARMEPILRETYGTIVYQEQVMEITKQLAGFTPSEADKFRKGMGKKKPEIIAELKPKFYKGCLEGGMSQVKVDQLWVMLERFAEYGFNKSHAAAYAEIGYRTAYLAHYYPLEFYSAYLTGMLGKYDKLNAHTHMIRALGVEIFPPSVNESDGFGFAPSADHRGIRFGLRGIKGLRKDVVEVITRYSPFQSFAELGIKLGKLLTTKTCSLLTDAGALECLGRPSQSPMRQFQVTGLFFGDSGLEDFKDIGGGRYQCVGVPIEIQNRRTRKGDPMATLKVLTASEILTVMSFKETVGLVTKNHRYVMIATLSTRGENEYILSSVTPVDEDETETRENVNINNELMGVLFT
ncbi:DNA polymerase III subunit alpha [Peptococcaceae bacterium CEB3]|nr:DNA polymerase III subunit alpha [Peptococcaceae bacterium CEB3]